ncbi:putative 3-beta hydroxysteroid dehydrogenase/isomerase family protein [Exophiala viscosa]|uniref:3-beta hydroxysteroid dehydrogenase/isomerase family protein n=1 Tax=Exophiala viscosa TaxID=2486360 RepID=A0AAN6DTG9_9EURO|nr:putative 3-beta hydroxysteroid dehydrogenase/isomerase family protein [Exophiala viscosa]KAI1623323.1 putative 3-beta hydroxysteroid dehydrogenase/isomerase family protein [Exophiala viscosa]
MAVSGNILWAFCFILVALTCYLLHVDRALKKTPKEVAAVTCKPWTDELIREAYEKYRSKDDDFKKYLPPKQDRRYIVFGGSGVVGGWIVEHLILRGQDPNAVRIADLQAPRRQRAVEHNVPYFKTDVTDARSVAKVFEHPWPHEHAHLPLTVFYTVAFIHPGLRKADLLPRFMKVNVEGTRNAVNAAKSAGCDVFIVTSSVSIAMKPVNLLFAPWKEYPDSFVQFSDNAEPNDMEGPLEDFAGCYAYSKARAEKLVRDADDKKSDFRTGAIRPGHAIYGHGDANPSSVVYDYLRRGGMPSWLSNVALQVVSAQNVSLAHLLYEARMQSHDLGGRVYAVTDDMSHPFTYGDLYRFLEVTAHPTTPIKFPTTGAVPIVIISHIIEAYSSIQRRYLRFLPEVRGDLAMLQPALFNYSTVNIVYDDSKAREELGYTGTGTLEGLSLHVRDWNEEVEAKLAAGKTDSKVQKDVQDIKLVDNNVPVAPIGVAR